MSGLPIACTLSPHAYAERVAAIAALNRAHLRSYELHELALQLEYALEASELVTELVRQESDCCAFLEFERTEVDRAIRLRVTVPAGARNAASLLFAPFLESSEAIPIR